MLSDELDSLKKKIEEYKSERNVKLNEINDLTIKLKELNNEYEINEKRVITTNKYSIFAMSIIIIGLIIYVLKTNLVKKYS